MTKKVPVSGKQTFIVTQGLPGSGKSTWAKIWVSQYPAGRVRISRDDLRAMMHEGVYLGEQTEAVIVKSRNAIIKAALYEGKSIVVDETCLVKSTMDSLRNLSVLYGVPFEVQNFFDTPLEECIRRNNERQGTAAYVPEAEIRRMWDEYTKAPF